MNLNSKLDKLKEQVYDTSNQQYQIQQKRQEIEKEIEERERISSQNKNEMQMFIRSVVGQSEIANARDREILQDKIDKFSFKQQQMNEQLINLNENLTDTTALESLYKTKKDELEQCFKKEKESLQRQIKSISDELEQLDKEIKIKTSKIEEIQKDLKKNEFLYNVKRIICDKWLAIGLAGLVIVFIGGFFGWAIYDFFHWLMFDVVFEFYNKIYNKI